MDAPKVTDILQPLKAKGSNVVKETSDSYHHYFDKDQQKKGKDAVTSSEMTRQYYDLATDFYEYGWGESFHFAPLRDGESREHSLAKHEYYLALRLGITSQDRVLDCGCGIGGPARHISLFTGARVLGVNINQYQVDRATTLSAKQGLDDRVSFRREDFCQMSFPDNSFDKIYAIEATCHAEVGTQVFGEIYRVLKPGGLFAGYDWCMTMNYKRGNKEHDKIKHDIMEGGGLPDLRTTEEVRVALEQVGFEVLDNGDFAERSPIPWYTHLTPKSDFRITPLGRWVTHVTIMALEMLRFAPEGATKVHETLSRGADALVKGGESGIFTAMYFFLVRKPLD